MNPRLKRMWQSAIACVVLAMLCMASYVVQDIVVGREAEVGSCTTVLVFKLIRLGLIVIQVVFALRMARCVRSMSM